MRFTKRLAPVICDREVTCKLVKLATMDVARLSRDIDESWIYAIDAPSRVDLARQAAGSARARSAPISIGGCNRSCALRHASQPVRPIRQRSAPGSGVGNALACLLQLCWGCADCAGAQQCSVSNNADRLQSHCWCRSSLHACVTSAARLSTSATTFDSPATIRCSSEAH
jgi:hypothetical protein